MPRTQESLNCLNYRKKKLLKAFSESSAKSPAVGLDHDSGLRSPRLLLVTCKPFVIHQNCWAGAQGCVSALAHTAYKLQQFLAFSSTFGPIDLSEWNKKCTSNPFVYMWIVYSKWKYGNLRDELVHSKSGHITRKQTLREYILYLDVIITLKELPHFREIKGFYFL